MVVIWLLYLHQHVFFNISMNHQHFTFIINASFHWRSVSGVFSHYKSSNNTITDKHFQLRTCVNDCSYTAFTAIKCVASEDIINSFLINSLYTEEEQKYTAKRIPATMSIACIMLHYSLKSLRYRLNKAWNVLCIHYLVRGSNCLTYF